MSCLNRMYCGRSSWVLESKGEHRCDSGHGSSHSGFRRESHPILHSQVLCQRTAPSVSTRQPVVHDSDTWTSAPRLYISE